MLPFESGVSEEAPGQQRRFTVSFYLTAMLFILFDIEIVFLYPLAVQLERSAGSGSSSCSCSSRSSPWRTSTSGARERSSGTSAQAADGLRPPRREGRPPDGADAVAGQGAGHVRAGARVDRGRPPDHDRAEGRRVGAVQLGVARHVRARVLRDRDDVDRLVALRHRAVRDGALQLLAAAGRPADRLRARHPQDGGAASPGVRPDARAEVGHRDGRVRELGRDVQQLHRPPGRRQDRPGRHPRAGLPAAPRGADGGHRPPPREDPCRRAVRRTRSAGSPNEQRSPIDSRSWGKPCFPHEPPSSGERGEPPGSPHPSPPTGQGRAQ